MRYYMKNVLLIILFTLLITTYIYYNFWRNATKTSAKPIYTFIHPTKTGGTACETFFNDHYSEFIKGTGHDNKCMNNNNPIVIIRDPIDRFISMYKYWKYGSLDIDKYKRNDVFLKNYNDYTIKDFIQLIKNKQHGDLYQNFTWGQHFQPVVKWINKTNYKNIIVIIYERDLNEKINKLFDVLKIKNNGTKLPIVNISNNKENIQLDDNDILFIKSYFADDFNLYDDVNNRPELFKHVI